jgi:elongation factor G
MTAQASTIRNIAFVGHPSAGKTTLIDALAFQLGASDRRGSVADKTSICDTEPEEQEKGHTLQMKVVHVRHKGETWNLIDTPGYPDFQAEASAGIYGADLVVGVLSATSGVTYNFRNKLRQARELRRGTAVLITHLDSDKADFEELVESLRERIGKECVPLQVPDKSGAGFSKVANVLGDPASRWRGDLLDRVVEASGDDELYARYLDAGNITDAELHKHLPVAIERGGVIPILACNPAGGAALADFVAFLDEYAPSPESLPVIEVGGKAVAPVADGELLGVVFCLRTDPHVGRICLARILRGTLRASDLVLTPAGPEKGEKLGGLFYPIGGKKREVCEAASAGEIVAIAKVESLGYAHTFTAAGTTAGRGRPPATALPAAPRPMVAMAVTPKSRNDEQKLSDALHKLIGEDPSLELQHNALTHELVLHGLSDLHLKVIEQRLKRRHGVEIAYSIPKIPYRETVTRAAEGHHRHKKQTGGRGQFGECFARIRPGERDGGVKFVDAVVGGSIPRNLIPAVEKGMREQAARGVLSASQVVDVEFEVYDGKYHEVDSDEASFKIAGSRAFKDAFLKASPVILEPVMEVEIAVPTEHAGAVFSDVTSHRRGQVVDQSSEEEGALTIVKAHIPLSTIQTYQRDLKSQTAGEGSFRMRVDHYAPVPPNEQQQLIARFAHHADEE